MTPGREALSTTLARLLPDIAPEQRAALAVAGLAGLSMQRAVLAAAADAASAALRPTTEACDAFATLGAADAVAALCALRSACERPLPRGARRAARRRRKKERRS